MVKYKIKYNKRNKRYVVFEVPPKGLWKIRKSCKTKKEATKWVRGKSK